MSNGLANVIVGFTIAMVFLGGIINSCTTRVEKREERRVMAPAAVEAEALSGTLAKEVQAALRNYKERKRQLQQARAAERATRSDLERARAFLEDQREQLKQRARELQREREQEGVVVPERTAMTGFERRPDELERRRAREEPRVSRRALRGRTARRRTARRESVVRVSIPTLQPVAERTPLHLSGPRIEVKFCGFDRCASPRYQHRFSVPERRMIEFKRAVEEIERKLQIPHLWRRSVTERDKIKEEERVYGESTLPTEKQRLRVIVYGYDSGGRKKKVLRRFSIELGDISRFRKAVEALQREFGVDYPAELIRKTLGEE